MIRSIAFGVFLSFSLAVSQAQAAPIHAVAVGSVGSSTPVAVNKQTDTSGMGLNTIEYFIPLSSSASGIFGVDGKGVSADSGSGYGYDDADALGMYLRYELFDLSASDTVVGAKMEFNFADLDLGPNNDPYKFFESLRITLFNTGGTAFITNVLKNESDAFFGVSPTFLSPPGLTSTLVGSGGNTMMISFEGALLDNTINGILDGGGDSLFARLDFGSKYKRTATNTAEMLNGSATLDVLPGVQVVVPEPATLAIWSLLGGIGLIAGRLRRRRR